MTISPSDRAQTRLGERRRLGRAELPVSPIGLGLAALGRPTYITLGRAEDLGSDRSVDALRRLTHALLDAAYAAGVRYFDAARSYGYAEEFLASWLAQRRIAAGEVTVGSKWGYSYTGGWRIDAQTHEVKDLSVSTLRRQLDETRTLLGEHLSLYQIYSATLESGVLEDEAVIGELATLKEAGLAVGLTVTGPRQAETIERALKLGLFDTVQATWNLLERSTSDVLGRAHAAGLVVIVKEALANGRLTARGGEKRLLDAAGELGHTADSIALCEERERYWLERGRLRWN
jgi:aryl-alcohol dehydrogenase-like predicted oxidoreductase